MRGSWYTVIVIVVSLALTAGLMAVASWGRPIDALVRAAALLGYQAVFLAIVSSAYVRQLVRAFGRPFIKVHHIVSVTGLVLVTLHPVAVAVRASSLGVFVPRFESLRLFLQFGGSLAWYLLVVAALTAALRKPIGRFWRTIHVLNYVAFLLGTVHGIMMGTDLQYGVPRVVAVCMGVAIVGVLVQRRLARRKQRAR